MYIYLLCIHVPKYIRRLCICVRVVCTFCVCVLPNLPTFLYGLYTDGFLGRPLAPIVRPRCPYFFFLRPRRRRVKWALSARDNVLNCVCLIRRSADRGGGPRYRKTWKSYLNNNVELQKIRNGQFRKYRLLITGMENIFFFRITCQMNETENKNGFGF